MAETGFRVHAETSKGWGVKKSCFCSAGASFHPTCMQLEFVQVRTAQRFSEAG